MTGWLGRAARLGLLAAGVLIVGLGAVILLIGAAVVAPARPA